MCVVHACVSVCSLTYIIFYFQWRELFVRTVKLMGMILLIMKVHVNGSQSVFSLTCIYSI